MITLVAIKTLVMHRRWKEEEEFYNDDYGTSWLKRFMAMVIIGAVIAAIAGIIYLVKLYLFS